MKQLSEDLFQLIKSLSGHEKRYFKISVSRHVQSGNNKYLLLFDMIDKQKVYDEEKVKKRFTGTTFAKHLASKKIYLFKLIFKILRNYYKEISIEARMKNELREIEIAFQKGLYHHCEKAITRAKHMAYEYELYEDLLLIMRWERRVQASNLYYSQGIVMKFLQEREEVIGKILRLHRFRSIQDQMFSIYMRKGPMRTQDHMKEAVSLINDLKKLDEGHSFHEKISIYYTYSYYYTIICDTAKQYQNDLATVNLYEAHPHRLKNDIVWYVSALNNLLMACARSGLEKEFYKHLSKMRAIPKKFLGIAGSTAIEANIFERSCMQELFFYLITGKFEKGLALLPEVNAGLKKFKSFLNGYITRIIYGNIAALYFFVEDYRNALRWQQKIFNTGRMDLRDDITCFAKIFSLIIHYELGNKELLEHAIRSTVRFLHKRNKIYKLENIFLDHLRKFIKLEEQDQIIHSFKALRKRLLPLLKDPFEKHAFEYFDIITWLESKIENKSFNQVYREKLNAER